MTSKFKGATSCYHKLILMLGLFFDRFVPNFINSFFAVMFGWLARQALKYIQPLRNINFAVLIRHSAKTKIRYNPFFSDIDLAIIIASPLSESDEELLRSSYYGLKQYLPFMGEVEIFLDCEFEAFTNIQSNNPVFLAIRDLRKMTWLEEDVCNGKSQYHRHKAQRSLQTLCQKYDTSIDQLAQTIARHIGSALAEKVSHLNREIDPDQFDCQHLRLKPIGDLFLNRSEGLALISILPLSSLNNIQTTALGLFLSANPELLKIRINYLNWESLQLSAVYRFNADKFPWMKAWNHEILEQINYAKELTKQLHSNDRE